MFTCVVFDTYLNWFDVLKHKSATKITKLLGNPTAFPSLSHINCIYIYIGKMPYLPHIDMLSSMMKKQITLFLLKICQVLIPN